MTSLRHNALQHWAAWPSPIDHGLFAGFPRRPRTDCNHPVLSSEAIGTHPASALSDNDGGTSSGCRTRSWLESI